MNVRALTLGAVLGFVIAVVPSCGGSKCGPQNCGGCCDSAGKCVAKPNNANNSTCGASGNTCDDCTAKSQACNPNTNVCEASGTGGGAGGGTGGGSGGGGGTTTCDGCRLPNGTCVPLNNTSVNNCGSGGATCAACSTGQLCISGGCQTVDAGTTASIGSACASDSDCAAIPMTSTDQQVGFVPFCKKTALDLTSANGQGYAYTNGYCSKRCGFEQTSCGTGNRCFISLGQLGEFENVCFDGCTADTECRTGYFCLPYSNTAGVCMPETMLVTLPDGGVDLELKDAGAGFGGESGAACADDTACQPPANGSCITEQFDGGPTGYTGGACSAECGIAIDDAWCGNSGSCNPYAYNVGDNKGPVVFWQCDRACGAGGLADGGTAGNCRTGYVCDTSGNGYQVCNPDCRNAGFDCGGATCNQTTGICE